MKSTEYEMLIAEISILKRRRFRVLDSEEYAVLQTEIDELEERLAEEKDLPTVFPVDEIGVVFRSMKKGV